MTLQMWSDKTGVDVREHPESGCKYVIIDPFAEERKELFWLDDYVVSTVSGIVHWMVARGKS